MLGNDDQILVRGETIIEFSAYWMPNYRRLKYDNNKHNIWNEKLRSIEISETFSLNLIVMARSNITTMDNWCQITRPSARNKTKDKMKHLDDCPIFMEKD